MTSKWMWAVPVAALCTGSLLATQATTSASPGRTASSPGVSTRVLARSAGTSAVSVVDIKLAPGASTGWRSHAGPSLVSVVTGTVTSYSDRDPRCMPLTYARGTGFVDPGGSVHLLRNETGHVTEAISVQLPAEGAAHGVDASPKCRG